MDSQRIAQLLTTPAPIRCFDTIDSTNLYAKAWARAGAPFGVAVLSDRQTAGRGRRGKSYFSPAGGLYLSVILPPQQAPGRLTTLAAVAVRRAVLGQGGPGLQIKWVNDLLLNNRKVCGILVEGLADAGGLTHAVLGIGLNTFNTTFPEELQDKAALLNIPDRERLAAAILNEIQAALPLIPGHMPEYRAHCLTLGQSVSFTHEGTQRHGTARHVDDDGALWVDTDAGPLRLMAGEVSIRTK